MGYFCQLTFPFFLLLGINLKRLMDMHYSVNLYTDIQSHFFNKMVNKLFQHITLSLNFYDCGTYKNLVCYFANMCCLKQYISLN